MDEANINLTPLIDVVFVVLIMFILIAPMLELNRVELASASPRRGMEGMHVLPESHAPITIHVRADDTIWINGKKILPEELFDQMKFLKQRFPKTNPQLFHDKKARFGTYQRLKNVMELVGFEEVDLILQPDGS